MLLIVQRDQGFWRCTSLLRDHPFANSLNYDLRGKDLCVFVVDAAGSLEHLYDYDKSEFAYLPKLVSREICARRDT